MHGMVDTITAKMENEQTNKSNTLQDGKVNLTKIYKIAMIVIVAVIAIILVDLINSKRKESSTIMTNELSDNKTINVHENTDEKIDKFIKEYFQARTNLNYPKIFASFGRDYYKEERESKDDTFRNIVDNIRYEKIFVKSYDDIKIYTEKGYREDEVICIVTYDMAFGFTTDKAPMIAVFYMKRNGDTFVIYDKFDVGTSKYVVDVVNTEFVRALYDDVYIRLNRVLTSNESLKLVYNSFRQSEMNMKSTLGPLHKKDIIEKITSANKLDPIKDADEIYDEIASKKREENKYKVLDEYIERVIASLSDAQRAN
jgi:hypothetical protein